MKRLKVTETKEYDGSYLDGDLTYAVSILQGWIKEGWERMTVETVGYDYDTIITLSKLREENDIEYNKRMKQIEKDKKQKEKEKESRRNLYNQLKKEFDNE